MSTSTLQAPRLRIAAAAQVAAGTGFWHRLWDALEAQGQRRAAVELRRAAWRFQASEPETARQLLEAARFAERA